MSTTLNAYSTVKTGPAPGVAGEAGWLPASLLPVATRDLGLEVGHDFLAHQRDRAL